MASIESFSIKKNKVIINLKASKEEFKLLNHEFNELLILPTNENVLNQILTTGRLGNGNRIMIPKKFLNKRGVKNLEKKVNSQIFRIDGKAFLLSKIKGSETKEPRVKWHTTLIREK